MPHHEPGTLNIFELVNEAKEASLLIVAPLSRGDLSNRLAKSPPADITDWDLRECQLEQLMTGVSRADADWTLADLARKPHSSAWQLSGWRVDSEIDAAKNP